MYSAIASSPTGATTYLLAGGNPVGLRELHARYSRNEPRTHPAIADASRPTSTSSMKRTVLSTAPARAIRAISRMNRALNLPSGHCPRRRRYQPNHNRKAAIAIPVVATVTVVAHTLSDPPRRSPTASPCTRRWSPDAPSPPPSPARILSRPPPTPASASPPWTRR